MKYELIRTVSVENLTKAHACESSLLQFAFNAMREGFDFNSDIPIEYVILFATSQDDIAWLIDKNFIKQTGYTYHVGQQITWAVESDITKYIIVSPGLNAVFLASFENGQRFREPIIVQKLEKITQDEFNKMGGDTEFGTWHTKKV